jgi:hypothetical protein
MSAPTMKLSFLPLRTTTALTAAPATCSSSTVWSSVMAEAESLFTFSPGRSKVSQAMLSPSISSVHAFDMIMPPPR